MWMTTWLFPAAVLLLWFTKALGAQGHTASSAGVSTSPVGSAVHASGQHQHSAALALARAVWGRALGSIHGTAQRCTPLPLLLVPVPRLVPCCLDPDLASLFWCPASAGQTCLIAGHLPGSLGSWVILGTCIGPALLLLLGLCGAAASVQPCMPCCNLAPIPHPTLGTPREHLSLGNSAVHQGRISLWYVCWELWSPWEVVVGLAKCLLTGLFAGEGSIAFPGRGNGRGGVSIPSIKSNLYFHSQPRCFWEPREQKI